MGKKIAGIIGRVLLVVLVTICFIRKQRWFAAWNWSTGWKDYIPVFSAKTTDYTVSILEGYTFTVNGITVSDDYKTGKVIENPDFANVSKYVTMPKSVECFKCRYYIY